MKSDSLPSCSLAAEQYHCKHVTLVGDSTHDFFFFFFFFFETYPWFRPRQKELTSQRIPRDQMELKEKSGATVSTKHTKLMWIACYNETFVALLINQKSKLETRISSCAWGGGWVLQEVRFPKWTLLGLHNRIPVTNGPLFLAFSKVRESIGHHPEDLHSQSNFSTGKNPLRIFEFWSKAARQYVLVWVM